MSALFLHCEVDLRRKRNALIDQMYLNYSKSPRVMEDTKLEINCKHGKGIASIVCGHHLASNQPLGFIVNSSDPDDLQAWCYACEYLFQQEQEMTSRFKKFNNAKVVCERCFEEIKSNHSIK